MSTPIPIFINPSPADSLPTQYARVSLPFKRGAYAELPNVAVKNAGGESIPVQTQLLASWADGSPRVVHLTLRAPGGIFGASLEGSAAGPAPADAIQVAKADGQTTVSTGRLHAVFSEGQLQGIQLGEKELLGTGGVEIRARDENGRVFTASAARGVQTEIEVVGPLRTVIALKGVCTLGADTFLHFRLRFEFLAGVSGFSLGYTFFNLQAGRDFAPVRSINLDLKLARAEQPRHTLYQTSHGIFGLDGRLATTDGPFHVTVDDSVSFAHVEDFGSLGDDFEYPFYLDPPPDRVDNWGLVADGPRALLVEMDDFHLLRPKSLHLEDGEATFGVWPAEAGVFQLQQGRSREVTVRVALFDDGAPQARAEANAAIAQLRDVWRAQLAPATYATAQFLDQGRVLPFEPLKHPRFERWLRGMAGGLNSVATFFDLGDTPDAGYLTTYIPIGRQRRVRSDDGGQRYFSTSYQNPASPLNALEDFEPVWVNNEYDVIHGLGTEFLRSGDLSMLQKLRWFSRHTIDVDFLHYSDHKWLHRAQPAHSARHTTTGAYPSHFWSQGLAQYYYLTADPDALEVIVALADKTIENLDDPVLSKLCSGVNREVGWGILTLVCAYEASGQDYLIAYAARLLEEIVAQGLPRDIPVFSFGHTSLMLAIRQYLELYRDSDEESVQQLRNYFLGFVQRGIDCSRAAPPAEKESLKVGTYSYDMELAAQGALFSSTARSGVFEARSMVMDALAYAYEISGEEHYIRAGLLSLESMVDSAYFRAPVAEGKPFAMIYRTWTNYLKYASELGYLAKYEFDTNFNSE